MIDTIKENRQYFVSLSIRINGLNVPNINGISPFNYFVNKNEIDNF